MEACSIAFVLIHILGAVVPLFTVYLQSLSVWLFDILQFLIHLILNGIISAVSNWDSHGVLYYSFRLVLIYIQYLNSPRILTYHVTLVQYYCTSVYIPVYLLTCPNLWTFIWLEAIHDLTKDPDFNNYIAIIHIFYFDDFGEYVCINRT